MTEKEKEFYQLAEKGNWVAWKPWHQDIWAFAYMTANRWFDEAINFLNDGDMGKTNEFGIYERHWWNDSLVYDDETEYRPMTDAEIMLYITHCNKDINQGVITQDTLISNYKYDLFEYYIQCWVDCVNNDFDSFVKLIKQKYLKK